MDVSNLDDQSHMPRGLDFQTAISRFLVAAVQVKSPARRQECEIPFPLAPWVDQLCVRFRLQSPPGFAHAPLTLDLKCGERFIQRKRLAYSVLLKLPVMTKAERAGWGRFFLYCLAMRKQSHGRYDND